MTRLTRLLALAASLEVLLCVLPPGLSILDARVFYSADEALRYIAELGPRGRAAYVVHESVDLAFIATYTLLLRALADRWALPAAVRRGLIYAPGAADLVETTGILRLLAFDPPSRVVATVIGYATLLKWAALVVLLGATSTILLRRRERAA